MEAEFSQAAELIKGAGEVCLACHVVPDGDALGSMLAFGLGLRSLGLRCVASFGEPFQVPSMLRFLPGLELLVPPGDFPAEPEVMVTFDAASADRLGALAAPAALARELIVVDHHAAFRGSFGTLRLVDPAAAATAVLTERLLDRLGAPLTGPVALGLYAGLASDTGSFRYPTTTPQVHALAGRLVAAGVRPDDVARELWDRAPFGFLKVLSSALGRAVLEPGAAAGHGVVWTSVPLRDRLRVALPYEQLEGTIDVVRRCEEADVAVVLKETDDGQWYVSTRSKGAVDVGAACMALGGGGHRRAAAFTAAGEPDLIVAGLLALL